MNKVTGLYDWLSYFLFKKVFLKKKDFSVEWRIYIIKRKPLRKLTQAVAEDFQLHKMLRGKLLCR